MMMMMFLQPIFSNTRALPSFKKCSINASSSSLSPSRRRNRFRTWPRLKRTPGTCVCTSAWAEGVFATGRLWQTDSTTTMSPHHRSWWCLDAPPRRRSLFQWKKGAWSALARTHTHTHTHTPKVVERVLRLHSVSFLLLFCEEGKNFLLLSFLSLMFRVCLFRVFLKILKERFDVWLFETHHTRTKATPNHQRHLTTKVIIIIAFVGSRRSSRWKE